MLTTDSIYYKPLLPVITIKNAANNATLYTYNSFTDTGTTDKILYCSVKLSQNTHGEFTIQFEDQNKSLESTVTVGSRVQIDCGKQAGSLTRVMSGLVRKKGYTRGANNKVLYTISGTSTSIRLNERTVYNVSQAAKGSDGITININDSSRKADTLLANSLQFLISDGIISISNLAANSDVETFIANLNIEYGEAQDLINYIEDQSGGEVIVDTNDLLHLRYELKNNLFGRGFTIKNSNDNKANDDADDTMYLRGKNWSYEDDFYKQANYANRVFSILPAQPRPSTLDDLGMLDDTTAFATLTGGATSGTLEVATKFRPPHTRFVKGDIYIGGVQWSTAGGTPPGVFFRICEDNGGLPKNTDGVLYNIQFYGQNWSTEIAPSAPTENYKLANLTRFHTAGNTMVALDPDEIYLDTTKDYWLICTPLGPGNGAHISSWRFSWGFNHLISTTTNSVSHTTGLSTTGNGGTGWNFINSTPAFAIGRYRSHSMVLTDMKARLAVGGGLGNGLLTDVLLTEDFPLINTRESAYRQLATNLYDMARPRTAYNFPALTAPNIPPFPGDPLIIDDTILGFSRPGNQVVITTCGDMTYTWGTMGTGSYEAPTILSMQCLGVHPRYN